MRFKASVPVWFAGSVLLILSFVYHRHFGYPFFTPKWLFFYLSAAVAGLYVLLRRDAAFPKLSRFEWATLIALFTAITAVIVQTLPVGYEAVLADRLGFFIYAVFFCVAFASGDLNLGKLFLPALVSAGGIAAVGLVQAAKIGFSRDMPYYSLSSTLGHTNNAAQWLAALLCLILPFLTDVKNRKFAVPAWAVVFVSLVYIFLTRCRSIWVFLGLAAAFLAWNYRRELSGKLKGKVLLFAGAVTAVVIPILFYARGAFLTGKGSITGYRWNMWKATLKMIADRPLGVGPDQFEFAHLPYIRGVGLIDRYNYLARSPHNEFLRYLVEDGVLVTALIALLLGTFLFRYFRKASVAFPERIAVGLLLIFFSVEALFQFPFQNAQTVFLFAILTAFIVVKGHQTARLDRSLAQPIAVLFLVGYTVIAAQVVYSRLFETSKDYEKLTRACEWYPSNWRACFKKGKMEIDRRDFFEAKRTLQSALEIAPHNYVAMLNMSALAFTRGATREDLLEGCFYLWKHNSYFGKVSPYYERQFKMCGKKVIDYFEKKRPEKFYGRQL